MLKLKDSTGKLVGVLKDEDDSPEMVAAPELATPVEDSTEQEEGEEEDQDL